MCWVLGCKETYIKGQMVDAEDLSQPTVNRFPDSVTMERQRTEDRKTETDTK